MSLHCKWVYQSPFHTCLKWTSNCRSVNLHKGKQGKVVLLSATPPSKTCVHPLSALHSSHQIKFLLRSALVLYLQNVLLEQHKHVTMRTLRGVSHRVKPASWSNHLHFLPFCLSWAELRSLSTVCLIFLFVFSPMTFSWKTGHYACVSLRSRFGGISPDQGESQTEWAW